MKALPSVVKHMPGGSTRWVPFPAHAAQMSEGHVLRERAVGSVTVRSRAPQSSEYNTEDMEPVAQDAITPVAGTQLPSQGDAVVAGIDAIDYINRQLQDILKGPPSTEDYLAVGACCLFLPHRMLFYFSPASLIMSSHLYSAFQEFLAIQSNHPRAIGFFGTRNMGFMHQQLIEVLSYAMVLTVRLYYAH
jgi:hypothetical protein